MTKNCLKKKIANLEILEIPGDPDGAYIILFHGFGSDPTDLIPLSDLFNGHPKPTWIFPKGPLEIPIGRDWEGYGWFPIDIEALQIAFQENRIEDVTRAFPHDLAPIRQKVEAIIEEMEIPRSKLLLGGFSQGAVLATEIALNSFQRCAALLIFSGTLINSEKWEKLAHIQKGLPFFQSHGTFDPLLPFKKAQELESLLLQGGCLGKLHAFSGGHEIPFVILQELRGFFKTLLDR